MKRESENILYVEETSYEYNEETYHKEDILM